MREASKSRTATDTDSYAFLFLFFVPGESAEPSSIMTEMQLSPAKSLKSLILLISLLALFSPADVLSAEMPDYCNVVWTQPFGFPENFRLGSRMILFSETEGYDSGVLKDIKGRMEFKCNKTIKGGRFFAVVIPDSYSLTGNPRDYVRSKVGSYEFRLPDTIAPADENFTAPILCFPKNASKEKYFLPWAYLRLRNFPKKPIVVESSATPVAGWFSFDESSVFPTDESVAKMAVDLSGCPSTEVYIPIIANQPYCFRITHPQGVISKNDINVPAGTVVDINFKGDEPDSGPEHEEAKEDDDDESHGRGYEQQKRKKEFRQNKETLDLMRKERIRGWIADRESMRKELKKKRFPDNLDIAVLADRLWKTMDRALPDNKPRALGVDAYAFQKGYVIETPNRLHEYNKRAPEKTISSQLKAMLIDDWSKVHTPDRSILKYPRFKLWLSVDLNMDYFFNSYREVLSEPMSAIIYKEDPRVYHKGKSTKYVDVKKAEKRLPVIIDECDSLKVFELGGTPITDLTIRNCGHLRSIILWGNQLETLTIENCPALESVDATINTLNSVTIDRCPNLFQLKVSDNKLKSIDLTELPRLEYLDVSFNDLRTLDVSKNPRLRFLLCVNNLIKALDISGLENLEILSCTANDHISLFGDGWPGGKTDTAETSLRNIHHYPWLWKWNITGEHKTVPEKELKKVSSDPFDWTRTSIFPTLPHSAK